MGSNSAPVPVPGGASHTMNGLGRSPPQVSAFPTASGPAGSPAKESSGLAKQEIGADDLMEE